MPRYNPFEELKKEFPSDQIAKVITIKSEFKDFSHKMRWLYSCLIFHCKCQPASRHSIEKYTGLCRTKTLPGLLTKLIELGLVSQVKNKFQATPPSPDNQFIYWIEDPQGGYPAYNLAVYQHDIIKGLVQADAALYARKVNPLAKMHNVSKWTIRRKLRKPFKIPSQEAIMKFTIEIDTDTIKSVTAAHESFKMLERMIFFPLAKKEKNQIYSAMVAKFGSGDEFEDWLMVKSPQWLRQYHRGVIDSGQFIRENNLISEQSPQFRQSV